MVNRKFLRYVSDYDFFVAACSKYGLFKHMSDEDFLRHLFKAKVGFDLNLDNPHTFNEKLQWLKIHDRDPKYSRMVDKVEAKEYVSSIIGLQYIIPTLGVWERFEEVDFNILPSRFVLKCCHDSGGVVICRDKSKFDIKHAKKIVNSSLRNNFYYRYREWPYKNVKPRILAEEYLEDASTNVQGHAPVLNDYKLQCFDGKFDNIFVAEGRYSKRGVRYHYFDRNWNYIPYCPYDDIDKSSLQALRPRCYEEMIDIAEKLSEGLPQLRVDLYEINGKVYFGEMTFYSQSGFDTDITHEADCILGSKLILPVPNAREREREHGSNVLGISTTNISNNH